MERQLTRIRELPSLPPRPVDAHKGIFGRVVVVAGSRGMSGAAVLCGVGALRSGAGLVQVAVPRDIGPIVAAGNPCYMTVWLPADAAGRLSVRARQEVLNLARSASAVVAGPGLGGATAVVVRALLQLGRPLVLDADALNVLGCEPAELREAKGPVILTPHPGEFSRLTGLETSAIQGDRVNQAAAFAERHRVVVVLKGAGTVVSDGQRVYVNTTGNPGMATGGSGDVLAGALGTLLGQGLEAFAAAQLGVYLHGLAGDLAAGLRGEAGMLATDVLELLPVALRRHREAGEKRQGNRMG